MALSAPAILACVILWYASSAVSSTSSKVLMTRWLEGVSSGGAPSPAAEQLGPVILVGAEVPLLLCFIQFLGCSLLGNAAMVIVQGDARIQPLPRAAARQLLSVAAWFALGFATLKFTSLYVGVGLAEVYRAGEPLFSLVLMLWLGTGATRTESPWTLALRVASLLPVVGGVAVAAVAWGKGGAAFSWEGLAAACLANVAFAMRSVCAKKVGAALREANVEAPGAVATFSVITGTAAVLVAVMLGALLTARFVIGYGTAHPVLPLAWSSLGREASSEAGFVDRLLTTPAMAVLTDVVAFFAYNFLSFVVLSNVTLLTHAVCNAMRRVVTILFAVVVRGNDLTAQLGLGIGMAVAGSLAYSSASVVGPYLGEACGSGTRKVAAPAPAQEGEEGLSAGEESADPGKESQPSADEGGDGSADDTDASSAADDGGSDDNDGDDDDGGARRPPRSRGYNLRRRPRRASLASGQ